MTPKDFLTKSFFFIVNFNLTIRSIHYSSFLSIRLEKILKGELFDVRGILRSNTVSDPFCALFIDEGFKTLDLCCRINFSVGVYGICVLCIIVYCAEKF